MITNFNYEACSEGCIERLPSCKNNPHLPMKAWHFSIWVKMGLQITILYQEVVISNQNAFISILYLKKSTGQTA